jgi:hypothetical protein
MDIFSWSVPFLSEKIISLMHCIISKVGGIDENHGTEAIDRIKED